MLFRSPWCSHQLARADQRRLTRILRCLLLEGGFEDPISPNVLRTFYREQFRQSGPCPVDPALDGPNPRSANLRSLLIREPLGSHQQERFALFEGQLGQGTPEVLQIKMSALFRQASQASRIASLWVFHLTASLAEGGVELVALDREQPRLQVGAGLKAGDVAQGTGDRLLHQVVSRINTAAQRDGKRPQREWRQGWRHEDQW